MNGLVDDSREFRLRCHPEAATVYDVNFLLDQLRLAREGEAGVRSLLNEFAYLYGKLLAVHEAVVMDTPEDRELHDQAIRGFKDGLALVLKAAPR